MERLEAHHRPGDPFDKPMVLLKDVIEIFDLADFYHGAGSSDFKDHIHSLQSGQIGSALVNDDLLRNAIGYDGLLEKPACCCQVPAFR